jgi:hypothetical protein
VASRVVVAPMPDPVANQAAVRIPQVVAASLVAD